MLLTFLEFCNRQSLFVETIEIRSAWCWILPGTHFSLASFTNSFNPGKLQQNCHYAFWVNINTFQDWSGHRSHVRDLESLPGPVLEHFLCELTPEPMLYGKWYSDDEHMLKMAYLSLDFNNLLYIWYIWENVHPKSILCSLTVYNFE